MKLCDLVQWYTPFSGGIRTYLDAKRRYIAEMTEHDHVLVVPGPEDRCTRTGRLTKIEVAAPRIPGGTAYRFMWRPGRILAALTEAAPDVIEVGSPYLLPWVAAEYHKRTSVPIVGYYHTDFPEVYLRMPAQKVAGPWVAGRLRDAGYRYARRVYQACDLTVAASHRLVRRLRGLGVERCLYVPLGVDIQQFHPANRDRSVWTGFGLRPQDRILIYCGRLDAEKRVIDLVKAVERLPGRFNARLVLLGAGPLANDLRERAAACPYLRVRPYLESKPALARLLASADMYVTAGPYETFGLSVVEAQASGLPVVGVRAGALIERVRPDHGRLAAPNDVRDLARRMMEVLEADPVAMGQAARRAVEREYAWERVFRCLLQAYERLLHSPGLDQRALAETQASICAPVAPPPPVESALAFEGRYGSTR